MTLRVIIWGGGLNFSIAILLGLSSSAFLSLAKSSLISQPDQLKLPPFMPGLLQMPYFHNAMYSRTPKLKPDTQPCLQVAGLHHSRQCWNTELNHLCPNSTKKQLTILKAYWERIKSWVYYSGYYYHQGNWKQLDSLLVMLADILFLTLANGCENIVNSCKRSEKTKLNILEQ